MNTVTMIGNIAGDPDLKHVGTSQICTFRIGHAQGYGEKRRTVYWRCKAFGKTAERVAGSFPQGKPIFIAGRLEQEEWTAKDGAKRTDFVVMVQEAGFVPKEWPGREKTGSNNPFDDAPKGDDIPF